METVERLADDRSAVVLLFLPYQQLLNQVQYATLFSDLWFGVDHCGMVISHHKIFNKKLSVEQISKDPPPTNNNTFTIVCYTKETKEICGGK